MVDLTFPFPPHLQVEVEEPVAEVEEESAADIKVRICAARERALAKPGDRGFAFPMLFSLPACTPRHLLCLTFVPPRLHVQIETAPFDPRFPQTNQAKHCYTRYNEFHKCVPLPPQGRRRHAHKTTLVVVGCQNSANKYLSPARSSPLFFIVSGAKRRRAKMMKSARSMPSTIALCALLTG